jgi:hypothetical protein
MKETQKVAFDVLNEMYSEAEPGLDFDNVRENPDDYPEDWFQQHTLSKERQREIVNKHCDRHNLSEDECTSVTWAAILNYGPSYPDN